MKISTKGIYAVQFMIFLAQSAKGELVPLKDVAKATDISRKYLEQIALSLTTAQLVHSVRGASGGYRLARSAKSITMLDILTVTEGSLAPVDYIDDIGSDPTFDQTHYEVFVWRDLHKIIKDYLASVSLQDIVERSQQLAIDNYSI